MTIVIGILAAQVVNWQIAQPIPADYTPADIAASWNGQMAWRWMFWAAAIPPPPSCCWFFSFLRVQGGKP